MGVMGIPMRALLATTLALLCGSVVVTAFDGYNGLPRPAGMDQDPTTTYGPKPAVEYENKPANCIWYGWENGNYPLEGTQNCSTSLWASLSAANPASLSGFMYYVPLDDAYFDPLYNEYLCAIGCFDLTAASSPAAGPATPPTTMPPVAVPPAVVVSPPPVETTPPPSDPILVPPPATLFRPPPPALPLPPSPLPPSPTPSLIVEPPIASPPFPSISVPVSAPALSPETSPEISPETSPLSSPGSSPPSNPIIGPGPTSGGPLNVAQGGSATTTSAPIVLASATALFLCINFLI